MDSFIEILKCNADKVGIQISTQQLEMFNVYINFLLEYNQHTNLTAITEPSIIAVKHFVDSLLISKSMNLSNKTKVIDIGTGAGFPGMPIKILFPEISLTLVDSLNKRVNFLNELKNRLNLEVEVFHKRAEELSKNIAYRDNFDFAVSRAVASLNILSEFCLPFVKKDGLFIAMKGPDVQDEVKNAKNAVVALGAKIEKIEKYELPDQYGKRSAVFIKKIKATPKEYPRQSGKIIKKPL